MAIAYKSVGTSTATGTTSAIFTYPNGITAGDIIVLGVVNKYPPNAPSTLSGYSTIANGQGTGGAGAAGTDGGTVFTTAFYKVATGSETGNATVTVTSGNSSGANVTVYTKTDAGYDWSTPVAGNGADSTRGTAWSITAGSTMDIMVNDMVVVISGANADAQTYSAEVFTCGGLTIGTNVERLDVAITGGNDTRLVMSTHTITAGTATTAGTFTMTANGTLSAGASVIVRLREQWARGTVTPAEGLQAQTGDTAAVYTTYFATGADGLQAQTGDSASVFTTYIVTPSDGFQTQTGDAASGTFTEPSAPSDITPADGFQAQTGDAAIVFAGYRVTPANAQQDHYQPDPPIVRAGYPLTPTEDNQAQTGDEAVVRAGYNVTFTDGFQTQIGDAATLTELIGVSEVTPVDGFQAQAGDEAQVWSGYPIAPDEGFQSQGGDLAEVYSGYYIDFSKGYQAQTGDAATVYVPVEVAAQSPRLPVILVQNGSSIFAKHSSIVVTGRENINTEHGKNIKAE